MDSKIEGRGELERRGPVIVNTNKDGFLEFLARRERAQQDSQRISALENEIAQLKSLVSKLIGEKDAT